MEIAMVLTLALMGVYFFKSTDLPKDLKERSAQFQAQESQSTNNNFNRSLKITLPKVEAKKPVLSIDLDAKLAEMKYQRNLKEIQVLNAEIDKLTLIITSLEQELKANNERNAEIQSIIETHLISLESLQEKLSLMA